MMSIDGRGMFLTCKYAIEQMITTGGGSIVCLSSISGMAGQSRQSTYGPAKFVASGLTKHLAVEWAGNGIRVNAVAPGTINTERVQQLPNEPGGPEYLEAVKAAHPMGRLGEPSEVAKAILFLASDEASFITGAILPVDGDFWRSRRAIQTCWLFVRLSVIEQGHDLNNKSVADRQETRNPRDRSEYVRSKAPHAEKHSSGNQHNP